MFDIVSVYDVALAERPPFRPSYASGAMAHIKNTYNTGMILYVIFYSSNLVNI